MGVNVKLLLPAAAKVRYVSLVAAALLGNKKEMVTVYNYSKPFTSVKVDGVSVEPSSVAELANIKIVLNKENFLAKQISQWDGDIYNLTYHFEADNGGERLIMPACVDVKQALCVGLAKFFGGIVDLCDCDDTYVDYTFPEQPDIRVGIDANFHSFMNRLDKLKPLTERDVERVVSRK
jgi:hypothetical protein